MPRFYIAAATDNMSLQKARVLEDSLVDTVHKLFCFIFFPNRNLVVYFVLYWFNRVELFQYGLPVWLSILESAACSVGFWVSIYFDFSLR